MWSHFWLFFFSQPTPNPSLDPIGSIFQIDPRHLLLTMATTTIWVQAIVISHWNYCKSFLCLCFYPCYCLFSRPFSLEQPDWSRLHANQVVPLLCSKVLLPLSLRLKARDPRWFFRELAGHFSDFSPSSCSLHSGHTDSLAFLKNIEHILCVPVMGTLLLTPISPTVRPTFPFVLWFSLKGHLLN